MHKDYAGLQYELSASPGLHRDVSTAKQQSQASPGQSTTASVADLSPKANQKLPPIARAHDILNLWLVGILTALTIGFKTGHVPAPLLLWSTVLYFVVDTTFVYVYPESVKSPNTILGHHMVTMVLVAVPYYYPMYMPCLADCMLVEVNTWLLISKRTIPYLLTLQEALFYLSWVLLRLVWYPYLVYDFTLKWLDASKQHNTYWNGVLCAPLLQLFLTGLNVHWTLALLLRKKKGPRSKLL